MRLMPLTWWWRWGTSQGINKVIRAHRLWTMNNIRVIFHDKYNYKAFKAMDRRCVHWWKLTSWTFTSGLVSRNCTNRGWSRSFPPSDIACSVDDNIPEVRGDANRTRERPTEPFRVFMWNGVAVWRAVTKWTWSEPLCFMFPFGFIFLH